VDSNEMHIFIIKYQTLYIVGTFKWNKIKYESLNVLIIKQQMFI